MLKGKYLAGMLAAYIAVFVPCFYLSISPAHHLCLVGILLVCLAISILFRHRRYTWDKRRALLFFLSMLLLVFSFGYSRWFVRERLSPVYAYADENAHTVTAVVEDIRYEKAYASAYMIHIEEIDGKSLSVGAILEIPFAGSYSPGDTVAFEGVLSEITDEYQYYHKAKGVLVYLEAEDCLRIDGEPIKPSIFDRIREGIAENFQKHIGDGAGYATALLTGIRDDLDGQTRLAYQRLGISHVLAVSGMHFSVIIGGLDALFRALTFPRKKKNALLIVFSWMFALICGFSASIVRALLMFCIYYIADMLGERSDSMTSLFFAAACIVTGNPWAVYDAGLWLSVFSTFGILLVIPSMNRFFIGKKEELLLLRIGKRLLRAVFCMMVMNMTALFFTMPITYVLYGGVSLISPLANLIFIPLTELILYLLIMLTVFGALPVVAPLLGSLCASLIAFADQTAQVLSDIRGVYLSIQYPFAIVILILMTLAVLVMLLQKEFRVRRLFAVFLSSALAFGLCFAVYTYLGRHDTYLYMNTDGKSDVLTVVDDGEVMMIDVASGGKRVPQMAVNELSAYCRCEIDTYVLTHLHSYHAGTLKWLSEEIKVHCVMLPRALTEKDAEYLDAIVTSLNGACEIAYYERNGKACVSVGETDVVLPDDRKISRSDHPVISFSARIDDTLAWMYCGSSSMEIAAYRENISKYRVVIYGAHGAIVKNIFDTRRLSMSNLVVCLSKDTAALIDPSHIHGELALVSDRYHIRFEHGK